MRHTRVLSEFILFFIILSMVLWGNAETAQELENRLLSASSPPERLEYLSRLVKIYSQEDPQKAREYGKQALQILENFPNDTIKVKVLCRICWASGLLGEYREALASGKEAEALARKIGNKEELAVALGSLANTYLSLSDFTKALDYALQAKTESEKLGYKRGIASALNSLARVHRSLEDYDKALNNYKKALEISEELGNRGAVAMILSNIANVHWNLKKYQKALDFYSHGLKIMEELGSEMGIAHLKENIACVYSETGEHTRALQYDMQALQLFEKLGNKRQVAFVLGSIGRDYGNLGDYDRARHYMDKGLKIATQLGINDAIQRLYEEYTHIYESRGDYQKALLYHKKFKHISDEIVNQARSREIAHLQVVYDVEKKDRENQLLKKNNHIQKLQFNFLVLVSVLVFIIAVVIYNRYRTRKKTEQVLRASEQKLMKMNASKDKLFAIIAHDLGSPLNSLLLSARHLEKNFHSLEEQDRSEFIHNIYKQTQDMADILENLLQWAMVQIGKIENNPETVDMRLLTEQTFEQIKYTAQKKNIQLSLHIEENTLAWADKHMMKAVMRNLLSNAIKYTHPGGEVKIMSEESGEGIEIIVSDNGVGMDKEKSGRLFKEEVLESTRGTANEKGTGLGLVLCREFVEKNGGQIWVQSQLGQGSHFSFTLPKQQ